MWLAIAIRGHLDARRHAKAFRYWPPLMYDVWFAYAMAVPWLAFLIGACVVAYIHGS